MNTKYNDILDTLIKAYYNDTFDETLNMIITSHEISPQDTFKVITSLCGVDIEFDNNYLSNLKKAISNYIITNNIVTKVRECKKNCKTDSNNKHMCETICPFDAIIYDYIKSDTYINSEKCIHCGKCVDACKCGNIIDKIEFIPILNLIKNNQIVVAAIDSSIISSFGSNVSIDKLRTSFKRIGFTDMIEVLSYSDIGSVKEPNKFNKKVDIIDNSMITSYSCPIVNEMIEKCYKDLTERVSTSIAPIMATGIIIKKLNPQAKVVFVGSSIFNKIEAQEKDLSEYIDFVLTFEEVNEIFNTLNIIL